MIKSLKEGNEGMDVKETFRLRVLELCEEWNISLSELARRAEIPKATLFSAVGGNPSLTTAARIAAGLDVSLREFFGTDDFDTL